MAVGEHSWKQEEEDHQVGVMKVGTSLVNRGITNSEVSQPRTRERFAESSKGQEVGDEGG